MLKGANTNKIKNANETTLFSLYKENGIDLNKDDTQFYKYKLLTYVESMEFIETTDARIFDKRINKTIFLKIDKLLLNLFIPYITNQIIHKIAFKPKSYLTKDGRCETESFLEILEYGRTFSFIDFKYTSVSKFVDYTSNDKLWIKVEKEKHWITFEEIIGEFKIEECDSIPTQILHLEYIEENDEYFIKHLDHEIAFYTLDEYEIRQKKCDQKGTSHPREKTFKIDDSRIPFILEDGRNFIMEVLDLLFANKELLKEYFFGVAD